MASQPEDQHDGHPDVNDDWLEDWELDLPPFHPPRVVIIRNVYDQAPIPKKLHRVLTVDHGRVVVRPTPTHPAGPAPGPAPAAHPAPPEPGDRLDTRDGSRLKINPRPLPR